jgi:predicted RNase H-like HicB family nuclease
VTSQSGADAPEQRPDDAYPIVLARAANGDGPGWIATVEELPGCEAHGPTPESAAAGMGDAVDRWVRAARADGREVPPPGAAAAHSGRLLVRMPRSLHAELVRASDREGTSLNAYIVAALSASVAWRRPGEPGGEPATPPARGLSLALKANLVVLAIAAAVAIALLITAWLG